MPPQSPNKIVANFQAATNAHTKRFLATANSVDLGEGGGGYTKLQLRRGLAVDYFFRVATDWQVFQDNWSVKALAHKPKRFLDSYQQSLIADLDRSSLPSRLAVFTEAKITVPSLGSSLLEPRIRQILDAEGRNLEFASSAKWKKWAVDNLADPHKDTLSRALSDDSVSSFLDLVRQLRNYIAHRSSASLKQIQVHATERPAGKQVGLTGADNQPILIQRRNNIWDVGVYLDRGIGEPYGTPAQFMARRLNNIAESLKWSA